MTVENNIVEKATEIKENNSNDINNDQNNNNNNGDEIKNEKIEMKKEKKEKIKEKKEKKEKKKQTRKPFIRWKQKTQKTNLIVCGMAGASKSSLIRALYQSVKRINEENGCKVVEDTTKFPEILPPTDKLEFYTLPKLFLNDESSSIAFTYETNIIDTRGHGDSTDGFKSTIYPAIEYVRSNVRNKQKRVHFAIYVLTNSRFLDTDKYFIEQLCKYTNVIVVAGKSDTYKLNEFLHFQRVTCAALQSMDVWRSTFSSDRENRFPRTVPYPIVTNEREYLWTAAKVSETSSEVSCFDKLIKKVLVMDGEEPKKLEKIAKRLSFSGMFTGEYWKVEKEYLKYCFYRNVVFPLGFLIIAIILKYIFSTMLS